MFSSGLETADEHDDDDDDDIIDTESLIKFHQMDFATGCLKRTDVW